MFTLLATLAFSTALAAQTDTPEKPQLVTVGEIAKFAKAKNSFDLKTAPERNQRPGISGSGINIRIGAGRDPRTPGTNSDPTRIGDDISRDERIDYIWTTVFLSDRTVCKERDTVILCNSLKTTDRVRVTGNERSGDRGKGFYATEVVRLSLRD